MQSPQLLLIRGEGPEDTHVFPLSGAQVTMGRRGADIAFEADGALSDHHCTFLVAETGVYVRDEQSDNGVFLRIGAPVALADGEQFRCGEQFFRFERFVPTASAIGEDGAVFGGTPVAPWRFRVRQVLEGGMTGLAFCARKRSMTVGREDCDINFYQDPFISHYHSRLEERAGQYILTDLDSRNGTFVRISRQAALEEGDHLFIGGQLFRLQEGDSA